MIAVKKIKFCEKEGCQELYYCKKNKIKSTPSNNFKHPTWTMCRDFYKFRRHRFPRGAACSCSDRLDCSGNI